MMKSYNNGGAEIMLLASLNIFKRNDVIVSDDQVAQELRLSNEYNL